MLEGVQDQGELGLSFRAAAPLFRPGVSFAMTSRVQALLPELAATACAEEVQFTQSWNVWDVRPAAGCRARTGK
eukprot:9974401-Alexandrium_andersonii.AAC.1